jgi:hypothetical protein
MAFVTGQRLTADSLNVLFDKPIGRLVQATAQSLADATRVAVTFGTGSTVFDTHSFHSESTNNTRITPTKAGYYRFSGTGFWAAQTTPVATDVSFRTNGTTAVPSAWRGSGGTAAGSGFTQIELLMNGSTDYVELTINQDSSGAVNSNVSINFTSTVEWEFIREQ